MLLLDAALSIWGFIWSWVLSYTGANGNHYTGIWINAFTWVLLVQAVCVLALPRLVTSRPARFKAWVWYGCWMASCSLVLLIGMNVTSMARQFAWAFLWWPPLATVLGAAIVHRMSANNKPNQQVNAYTGDDVEASSSAKDQKPPACTKASWRKCWGDYWAFVGWSSMFWLAFLGFSLALQAAWLVHDQRAFPPPGQLYQIDLEDGTGYMPYIHMLCKGPKTPGLSTFIMESGGGSPGVALAGIVDVLAANGRRACWYDRLGFGWSSEATLLPLANQSAAVLRSTLSAAQETGPYILAGHSAGGQLAMKYGATYPSDFAGLALSDSYDDVAISLQYSGSENVTITLPSGETFTRPELTYLGQSLMALLDAVRAITPFGWARFITTSYDSNYPYTSAVNAAYGNNNKEWQAQWVVSKSAVAGVESDSDVLSALAGKRFWQGTGWPDFGSKPVLLLPAPNTLKPYLPDDCPVDTFGTDTACQDKVLQHDRDWYYSNLYATYLHTLSTNATMIVMPGDHDFLRASYQLTAQKLLEKFAGV